MSTDTYWVTILAHGTNGSYAVGMHVKFRSNETVDESSVREKISLECEKARRGGTSTYHISPSDIVLGWSKCEYKIL